MNARASNNFDFLRFVAASLVLISHSFILVSGNSNAEPLVVWSHGRTDLGECAVAIFFILSGFLIAGSWQSKGKLAPFFAARAARIFPGLFAMLFLLYLCGAFFSAKPLLDYLIATPVDFFASLFLHGRFELTAGVFGHNPYPSALNGSLWTLRYEVICYGVVAAMGWAGILKRGFVVALWLAALAFCFRDGGIAFVSGGHPIYSLSAWFLSGMMVYLYRETLTYRKTLWISAMLIACSLLLGIGPLSLSPLYALTLLSLASLGGPFAGFGKFGDFSYGMYIYAFPVEQFVVYLMIKEAVPMTWWMCTLVAFPVTLACAVLSWYVVEKKPLEIVHGRFRPQVAAVAAG